MKRIALLGALMLASCSDQAETTAAANNKPAAPERVRFSQQRLIAPDTFAVVFSASDDRAGVEAAAREKCQGRQWCKVLGWIDPAYAATAMPMTDREVQAQAFSLTINRSSGMDEAVWN